MYATIVFIIYGWAMITFFWKVPSWLYFLSLGEIAAILSYTFASSLVESTLILSIFLFAGLVLPSALLTDQFVIRGSMIVYGMSFWVALFNLNALIEVPTRSDVISFGIVALLTVSLGLIAADRIPAVRKLLFALSQRLTVFLYLWLPLSLLGMLFILFRIV
ncbi:MAG TPA: hypothetical protein VFO91_20875 [Anaerolineales bacterium]|nr:hypothetical protein [Anaerolineales bacterium]